MIKFHEGAFRMGRVVYLSDDALFAIKLWLRRRDKSKEFVFNGRSNGHLCYSSGRGLFRLAVPLSEVTRREIGAYFIRYSKRSRVEL